MFLDSNIPEDLKEEGLWCNWRWEMRNGKWTKPPYIPGIGRGAKSNDQETFRSYQTALDAYTKGGYDGLGIGVFNGFAALDCDNCVINGQLNEMAQHISSTLDSYTEYSPSGTGIRIIFKAPGLVYDKEKYYINNQKLGLEVYVAGCTKKYVTITGNVLLDKPIAERSKEIAQVLEAYMIRPTPRKATPSIIAQANSLLSETEVIQKAQSASNGPQFTALWQGDISGYPSQSEADLALANHLAFWCRCDINQMDQLFRQSGLMRSKWDTPRDGYSSTYGIWTLQKAINGCANVYDPQPLKAGEVFRETVSEPISFNESEWEAPIPFESVDTPEFPTKSLPKPIGPFVEALAESTQTPLEMGAILSLGVLATAFQGRYKVQINSDWEEPLCLYTSAVAAPGERKTAVIKALAAPIYAYEADIRGLEAEEIAINRTQKIILEKALVNAQNKAAKSKSMGDDDEAKALAAELDRLKERHPFRLLVDDTTPEKLIDIMEAQGGCITVASAEGGLFDSLAGKRDRNTNFDIYLKGHASEPITVDRIGRKSNHILEPRLTMMLTIQPEVLAGLMSNSAFKGRGLCGRFLYAMCKSKIGRRKIDPAPIPPQLREQYRQFVWKVLAGYDTGIIRLSEDAYKLTRSYETVVEEKLGAELEHMRDWSGKLVGAMVRIAALIHAAEATNSPTETLISPNVVFAAIDIADFLMEHAIVAYQVMGADEAHEDAKYLLKRIEETGNIEISKRDLWHLCKSKFKKVSDMDPALQNLVEMGYVRTEERKTGGRGRPTIKVFLNPMRVKNSSAVV